VRWRLGVLQKKKGKSKSKKGSGKKKGGDAPAAAAGDETAGMTREQVTCSRFPPLILLHQLSSGSPLAFRALMAF
jgi:hypothetical protein